MSCVGGASYAGGGGGLGMVLVHGLIVLRCGAWPRSLRLPDDLFSMPG